MHSGIIANLGYHFNAGPRTPMSADNPNAPENVRDAVPDIFAHLPLAAVYRFIRMPDGNGHFTYFGDGLKEILGLAPSEVYSNPRLLHDCIHESDIPRFLSAWEIATRDTVPLRIIVRQRHRSRQIRVTFVQSFPHPLQDGIIAWNGMLLDITDQFPGMKPAQGDDNELLRVCAWCNGLIGIDSNWQPSKELLEIFNQNHLTHGLCEACRAKYLESID